MGCAVVLSLWLLSLMLSGATPERASHPFAASISLVISRTLTSMLSTDQSRMVDSETSLQYRLTCPNNRTSFLWGHSLSSQLELTGKHVRNISDRISGGSSTRDGDGVRLILLLSGCGGILATM